MNLTARISFYENLAQEQKQNISILSKSIYTIGSIRIAVFVVGLLTIYFLRENALLSVSAGVVFTLVFVFLLKRYDKLLSKKERATILLKICNDELQAFQYDLSAFDGAPNRINISHDFSFDLDVFGENSIFQLINRTSLSSGKEDLADLIENPLTLETAIKERQEAIKELSLNDDFCLEFMILAKRISQADEKHISFNDKKTLHAAWKIAVWIAPILFFGSILLSELKFINGVYILLTYLISLVISLFPLKTTRQISLSFSKKSGTLQNYAQLFQLIIKNPSKSNLLSQLHSDLTTQGNAHDAILKLSHHTRNLELAFTFPVALLLNPILFWHVNYAFKIQKWMNAYGKQTSQWFEILAKFDALISLGTFSANHPDYTYPEISYNTVFNAQELGHPLIPREKCVKNDVEITKKPYFMIVTGANMAGKSTYLRTVGVNHFLAGIGVPVCAEKMIFSPGKLLTNLRTSDSLVNNESYFFAELKRLKMIIERLDSGEQGLFIILDEILKGTNSEDKQKGSLALMKRLINLGGNGIIATHDLALGNLEKEFPQAIKNFHFDAKIQEDTLYFDYKLHEGIAQNMNASFLMRSMGITE